MRIDTGVIIGPWPDGTAPSWTVGDTLDHLDRYGIQYAAVRSTWARFYDPSVGNDRLVDEISREPRLLPSFLLSPLDSETPAELSSRLRDNGVCSVWLSPARHVWSPIGAEAEPLMTGIEHAGVPVFLELADVTWVEVDAICSRLPDTDIVLSAVGYRGLRQMIAAMDRHPRLHIDNAYLGTMGGLEALVSRFGATRVLLGSGAPLRDGTAPWYQLDKSDLSESQKALVSGGNAARLLHIAPGPQAAASEPRWGVTPNIDFHAHIGRWPNTWVPEPDAASLERRTSRLGTVHMAVSSLESVWVDTVAGNEETVELARASAGKISAFVVANPHESHNRDLLRGQLEHEYVRGVKVHPNTHSCAIDDPRYDWVWELALEAGVPVLGHGFAGDATSDPSKFADVAAKHPELALVIGHSGATYEGFVRTIEVAREHSNLYAELCGSWMTGWWIRRLVDALGADRVIYGTDACLIDPSIGLGRVLGAGLDEASLDAVLRGNASRLLGLRLDHLSLV